jgi:hypothetical protein
MRIMANREGGAESGSARSRRQAWVRLSQASARPGRASADTDAPTGRHRA